MLAWITGLDVRFGSLADISQNSSFQDERCFGPLPRTVARSRKLGNPNASGLRLVFRLDVDGDYRLAHLLFNCVLDTVANFVSAGDTHIPRHHQASAQAGRFRSRHLEDWPSKLMAKIPAANVKLKRVYESPAATDGTRILIDRLWPRGISKEKAALDQWMKEIAPSTKLRKWFGHDPDRWEEFRRRYATEVHDNAALLDQLRSFARRGPITLVYSAHDELHNDAIVLRDLVLGR